MKAILRSSRVTFGTDLRTRIAFEARFRDLFDRFLPSRASAGDAEGLDAELDSVFEVARALRRNVVQGLHRQTDSGERIRPSPSFALGSGGGAR